MISCIQCGQGGSVRVIVGFKGVGAKGWFKAGVEGLGCLSGSSFKGCGFRVSMFRASRGPVMV